MDETLRSLQRIAATGCGDAQKRYIHALERAVGFSSGPVEEVYEATPREKGHSWMPKPEEFKAMVFPVESRIYGSGLEAEIYMAFSGLTTIGFTLRGFPQDAWDWLLGSLTSQISKAVEKAYQKGRKDAQKDMREALGI